MLIEVALSCAQKIAFVKINSRGAGKLSYKEANSSLIVETGSNGSNLYLANKGKVT